MRHFYALLGVIIVSACSQGAGSLPLSGSSQNQISRATGVRPGIKEVSRFKPQQYQTVIISGSGFGTMQPYDGDSAYIRILDRTGDWDAGHVGISENDSVWLHVTKWTDSKIVVTGFTNDYGKDGQVLHTGDRIEVFVWNAQDGNGPSSKMDRVK